METKIPRLPKNPEGHSPRWWKKHPEAKRKAEAAFSIASAPSPKKSLKELVWSWQVVAFVLAILFGAGLNVMQWQPLLADAFYLIGFLLLIVRLWGLTEYTPSQRAWVIVPSLLLLVGVVVGNHRLNHLYPFHAKLPIAINKPAESQPQPKEPQPNLPVVIQLLPGLSVDTQDIRANGAALQFWNNTKGELKNSDIILEMPPLKSVEYDSLEHDPNYFHGMGWERFKILAGKKQGSRFVHLWAKYLEPNERHFIRIAFDRKYDVGSLDEWHEKYHYGKDVTVVGQYVMGTPMATKDLAQ